MKNADKYNKISLDKFSKQVMSCQYFYTRDCFETCSNCPYDDECLVIDFTQGVNIIFKRYINEIEHLKTGKPVEPINLNTPNTKWAENSFYLLDNLDEISRQAKICSTKDKCSEACPLVDEDWCVGMSISRAALTIFARYAEEIERLKKSYDN